MTEQEWLTTTDPQKMLEFLRGKVSARKLRLFIAGCFRSSPVFRTRPLGNGPRALVELVERYADGAATAEDLAAGHRRSPFSIHAFRGGYAYTYAWYHRVFFGRSVRRALAARVLCDLFGPLPFGPVEIEPSWRTPAVVALAATVYEERRFEDMPVLADALEEAGCQDPDILSHLRGPGPHVRGCWALDLMLGKE
jgi:hypothetical protein